MDITHKVRPTITPSDQHQINLFKIKGHRDDESFSGVQGYVSD